jgi:hypothetical protein
VQKAIATLRTKQAQRAQENDMSVISRRYAPDISSAMKTAPFGLPDGIHAHDLRSIYMNVVMWGFVSPFSFDRTAMTVLGHDDLHSAKAYGNVRLENAAALYGAFGPLPM